MATFVTNFLGKSSPKKSSASPDAESSHLTAGGRNLVLLGIISAIIAISTVTFSLLIYHNSGDIYLDRSRPGFLPDEAEVDDISNDKSEPYTFEKSGQVDLRVLEDYLSHLDIEIQELDRYSDSFNADALSDKSLGF